LCKALLKPFTSNVSSSSPDNDDILNLEEDEDDKNLFEDAGKDDKLTCNMEDDDTKDTDDDIDERETMSEEALLAFIEITAAAKDAVTKVSMFRFIHMPSPYLMLSG